MSERRTAPVVLRQALRAHDLSEAFSIIAMPVARPQGFRTGRFREGFRMPARRERSSRYRAGVRKPPKNEPAGSGERLAVYGDLTGQRLWREMVLRRSLSAESR